MKSRGAQTASKTTSVGKSSLDSRRVTLTTHQDAPDWNQRITSIGRAGRRHPSLGPNRKRGSNYSNVGTPGAVRFNRLQPVHRRRPYIPTRTEFVTLLVPFCRVLCWSGWFNTCMRSHKQNTRSLFCRDLVWGDKLGEDLSLHIEK